MLTGAGNAFCSGGDAEFLSGAGDRGIPGLSEKPLERYQRKTPAGPSVAVVIARRCVHKALTSTLEEMLDYEAVAATMSAHTEDAAEGTKAFVEKRKPVFKGR